MSPEMGSVMLRVSHKTSVMRQPHNKLQAHAQTNLCLGRGKAYQSPQQKQAVLHCPHLSMRQGTCRWKVVVVAQRKAGQGQEMLRIKGHLTSTCCSHLLPHSCRQKDRHR